MKTHVTRLIDYQYMLPILNERDCQEAILHSAIFKISTVNVWVTYWLNQEKLNFNLHLRRHPLALNNKEFSSRWMSASMGKKGKVRMRNMGIKHGYCL